MEGPRISIMVYWPKEDIYDGQHHALFIYIDKGYPKSYHDVSIRYHSTIYQKWHLYFTHGMNTLNIFWIFNLFGGRNVHYVKIGK